MPGNYGDGRKRENSFSEKIVLLLHSHVDVPYSLVVGWRIVLCDGKNAAFVKFTISCRCRRAWKTSRYARAGAANCF